MGSNSSNNNDSTKRHPLLQCFPVSMSTPIIFALALSIAVLSVFLGWIKLNVIDNHGHYHGQVIDLTVPFSDSMPVFGSEKSLGNTWIKALTTVGERVNISRNEYEISTYSSSELTLHSHCGTHIDAFKHFVPNDYSMYNNRSRSEAEKATARDDDDVDSLNVNVLIGSALVIDIDEAVSHTHIPLHGNSQQKQSSVKSIDEDIMRAINVRRGVKRLLLKTSNSRKQLMFNPIFEPNYVGLTASAAKFIVEETEIQLIGNNSSSDYTHEPFTYIDCVL